MASIEGDSAAVLEAPDSASKEQTIPGEPSEVKGEFPEENPMETPGAAEENAVDEKDKKLEELKAKWPGWPGYSVFRLVVPVLKVGSIIGRKGDLIKKLVEETRARVRVLDGPITSPDRIVLISGKEDPEAALPPAVDALIRIFKRINGLTENDDDGNAAWSAHCLIRLLVPSSQAISLIGKQGSVIKSIQENSGASVRVISDDASMYAGPDERVVELQGEAVKVLKAVEAVGEYLRKFLVDQSVLPLFEKSYNVLAPPPLERKVAAWPENPYLHATPPTSLVADYSLPMKRDSYYLDHHNSQIDSHIPPSRFSLYAPPENGLMGHSSAIGSTGGHLVTQVAQTLRVPLTYAEDIIGVQGTNIDYIRRSSGAILTIQESRGLPDEITIEIKGTTSQVQGAQQLIQEFISGHKDPHQGSYGTVDTSYRPSYPQLGGAGVSSYSSSSHPGQTYIYGGEYGSLGGVGGYSSGNYRL